MLRRRASVYGWHRYVFLRNPNEALDKLLSMPMGSSGIYLIGCAKEIIYVGQSWRLRERPIESLGRYYHRVPNISLPWSMALAPCPPEEMDERESTAIRCYAPKFNTSIPSVPKSQGRMPEVIGVAAIFEDQDGPCGAFDPDNLQRQMEKAHTNPNPPWKRKRTRRKTAKQEPKLSKNHTLPVKWPNEHNVDLVRTFGVPISNPLPFKINLCNEGSVATNDGEVIGTWQMDENAHPSFFPNGASEPLFFDVFVGMLCEKIRDWHEASSEEALPEQWLDQHHLTDR